MTHSIALSQSSDYAAFHLSLIHICGSAFDEEVLVLEEEQAQKLLELLDGQEMILEPAEGGSYLSIEGLQEVLLPFLEQNNIVIDLEKCQRLFLAGI